MGWPGLVVGRGGHGASCSGACEAGQVGQFGAKQVELVDHRAGGVSWNVIC